MSIINALNTAVSGLNAQSHAFSDLSNNIANSQTTGYKASTTSFLDYVTSQNAANSVQGSSDSVSAITNQHTNTQGSLTASSNTLSMAISGQGFFNVAGPNGQNSSGNTTTFSTQQFYTRNGDFSQDKNGYLVNTSGYYLQGYQTGPNGVLNNSISPISVPNNIPFQPTKTTSFSISSAVGVTSGTNGSNTSVGKAYDSQGNAQDVTLAWKQSSTDPLTWTLSNASNPSNQATVQFNTDGSLKSVNGASQSNGTPATFNYSGFPQNMTVNLGLIGSSGGAHLSDPSTAVPTSAPMSSDSVVSGNYTGLAVQKDGSVMAIFDNGLSQLVAKIPIVTFANPNGLSSQNGQAYTATSDSGGPSVNSVGTGGAGSLSTASVESSTTDLTGDLTKLVVAQQAYGANTKIVSTANQILQTTLAMIQ